MSLLSDCAFYFEHAYYINFLKIVILTFNKILVSSDYTIFSTFAVLCLFLSASRVLSVNQVTA